MADQRDASDAASETVLESPLVDLSALDLAGVAELPGTALGTALRAVLEAARHPDAVFTAEHRESLSRS